MDTVKTQTKSPKKSRGAKVTSTIEKRLQKLLRFPIPDRVKRLRPHTISSNINYVGEIDYERIVTRVYRETEGEPMILRRARAFAALCREYPISIEDDNLLTGYLFKNWYTRPHGVSWNGSGIATPEDGLTEAELEEFEKELRPYWAGPDGKYRRTRYGQAYQRYTEEIKNLLFADADAYPQVLSFLGDADYCRVPHVCHTEIQQEKLLRIGLKGFIREAEERLGRIDRTDPKSQKKIQFLNGVIIGLEGACELGPRFARLAREMATQESNGKRAAELLKMAENSERVPANPPETFREAVQCVWTVHHLHWLENPLVGGITPGRLDQYLYPFYKRDIAEGRLTEEEALELIDCFMLKLGEAHGAIQEKDQSQWIGDPVAHHIDIGGIDKDGTDATNELSYLFLESILHTRTTLPNVGVLLHQNTPGEFLRRALECVSLGLPQPYFFNVHTMMRIAFMRAAELGGPPITLEMARNYGPVGCVEPGVRGLEGGYVGSGNFGVPHLIEYVFTCGINRHHQRRMGLDTGDPRDFKTFDEFLAAFEKQMQHVMGLINQAFDIGETVTAELEPTVFQSALIGDCIEKGLPREEGGARFNHGGNFCTVGTPDVANSLYAVKKLVFDEKKITMDTLCRALEANFVGYEDVRQLCLNVPKYGNDYDEVDLMHAYVIRTLARTAHQFENARGGKRGLLIVPLVMYILYGITCGALPSGRLTGTPLSDGISPTAGSDVSGPVAVLKSVTKSSPELAHFGQVLNMRLSPDMFRSESGYQFAASLMRTFVDSGALHVQFNVVDSETLRAAQREPELYKDLMVRVTGYAAYFVDLIKDLQDGIIARTEFGM